MDNTKKAKKSKISLPQIVSALIYLVVGGISGGILIECIDELGLGFIEGFVLILLVVYASLFLHIIIHEGGHLIFGLLTGYRFSSFRIGSIMLIKSKGKMRLKRLSLAGTGGQCLLAPPPEKDGKIPVMLYNFGGAIANIVISAVCAALLLLFDFASVAVYPVLVFVLIGVAFAITNGVPMRMGMVDNDGYNALSLGKNPKAMKSFILQLKVNEQQAEGVRLKNMPSQWFELPEFEDMKNNSMVAAQGVFVCNRLMDEQRFEEAEALMKQIMENVELIALYSSLMKCDRIYCELIGENRAEVLDKFLNNEQEKFMQSMKKYISVIRTRYAYALLAKKDMEEAKKWENALEKAAKQYPHEADIECERDFMAIAKEKALKA